MEFLYVALAATAFALIAPWCIDHVDNWLVKRGWIADDHSNYP